MAIAEHQKDGLTYLADGDIPVPHAFTTRLGGVSRGIYSSLNLGVNLGDEREAVAENYHRACALIGAERENLVFTRQVHGDEVRVVVRDDRLIDIFRPVPYEADGLVTLEPHVPLIIFTADCIPILLWDAVTGAVGAVHAGWRGTVQDIAGKAVDKMVQVLGSDPGDIRAAIGPGIGPCCFETGPEVPEAVEAVLGGDAGAFIQPRGEKHMVDLKGVNRALLVRAGLHPERISVSGACTMCAHETFWSHRFTGGRRGSQASLIMCTGKELP